ncbi:MAG: aminotransferase class I/II-fold pyridoxal phosphate-dependent enzyme, partial [Actinomycetes bacterium]
MTGPVSGRLPDFPWDLLTADAERARAHPDGIVDLSVGTPVDPTPAVVQEALRAASDAPGYPTVQGTARLREAAAGWVDRTLHAQVDPSDVLPTIGSKELVAGLAGLLGLGPGARVLVPELAYPTYAVGALVAGAQVVAGDSLVALGPARVDLVWVNSPSNPTG